MAKKRKKKRKYSRGASREVKKRGGRAASSLSPPACRLAVSKATGGAGAAGSGPVSL